MKYVIIIKADTNDGDYVTSIHDTTLEEINLITPVIEAIRDFKPFKINARRTQYHNYPTGDMLRDDLDEQGAEELYGHLEWFSTFDHLRPYGEYGIHTIESVTVLKVEQEIKLM